MKNFGAPVRVSQTGYLANPLMGEAVKVKPTESNRIEKSLYAPQIQPTVQDGRNELIKQSDLIAVMPQEQFFAQKDSLQVLVKVMWEGCLNALGKTFPDLAGENQGNDNVISIKEDFEKQPRTDDNILFIKKIVQNIVATTPIVSIKFSQQTKATQEQTLRGLLERILTSALVELVLKDAGESLYWCDCHAEYKRITLALLLINEIREKFHNKNKRIVYTSFASGNLLQDYIVLSELLLSHTKILVNFIDLDYPDIPALTKKDLRDKNPRNLHKMQMKNKQESADVIDSFKVKIAQVVSEKGSSSTDYNFDVNIYQNVYEYILRVQENPDEKSNVLIMVDPSVGSFGMEDFPSLANVINVWIDQEALPVFTIYIPRHHGAHLYQVIESSSAEVVEYLRNQLVQLITSTGANKKYTEHLTNAFVDKVMFSGTQITDELLANSFPQLMEIRANFKKEALESGYIDNNLLQPLTPVKLGDIAALLSWGTDAHISFQDLVWGALASNAIIYQFYAIDPTKSGDENNKIIKINRDVYKKQDVVVPNSGRESEAQYKRIL